MTAATSGEDRAHGVVDLVTAAADGDPQLSEDAKLVLLSALTDDDAEPVDNEPSQLAEAGLVYLKSITTAGFRGVGPEARLDLQPGPGVVVVAGRNGSGKSSFSEAVEVALTRTSYRWAAKSAQWRAGWRNLHMSDPCRIRVELAVEGAGVTTLGARWADGDELGDAEFWAKRPGGKREVSSDPLGWAVPLEHFRPLLSYDELGGILEARPSELYDRLSTVLGLGPIADAQERLDGIVKEAKAPRSEANKQVKVVKEELAAADDQRAAQAREHFARRRPDLDTLERLAAGVSQPEDGELAVLRQLARLTVPPADQVYDALKQWRAAIEELTESADSATDALALRVEMLTHAVRHVEAGGPGRCPVCGVGELDDAWAERTRQELEDLRLKTSALHKAGQRRTQAQDTLEALLPPMPDALRAELGVEPTGRADVVQAWQDATAVDVQEIDGPPRFAETYERLETALARLRASAGAELQSREDHWTPLASKLGATVEALRQADEYDARLVVAQEAATWLKDHANELRNERLRPVAELAKQIWALLRQESNVDLGGIELTGSKTQRRVVLSAEVDGEDADGALTVMSQGELHALALALFLPRATLPVSPFGFVVIDDPVQAMDPAKVDGLARVLEQIGKTHQVIVFTHDDRLPEATRRLGIDARILQVSRDAGSRVEITTASDPTSRYFDEARSRTRQGDGRGRLATGDPAVVPHGRRECLPGRTHGPPLRSRRVTRGGGKVVGGRADTAAACRAGGSRRRQGGHDRLARRRGTSPRGDGGRRIVQPFGARPGPDRRDTRRPGSGRRHPESSAMTGRTAAALLKLADLILSGTIRMPRGRGARVAALLTRTALEDIVDGLCRANGLDVPRASMRVKLACLRAVSADGAGDAALAWWGLSRACHQHAYEIAPSHLEVAHLASTVRSLEAVVATREPSVSA